MFKTIIKNSSAEIVEKKSKFIANIFYVESREEAEEIIKKCNKKYHDARHNCYAFRIYEEKEVIEKSSDDGEPAGTAGAPLLNILSKKELANILVIVTRYFGGILLGTGGLVKAYSSACTLALDNTQIIDKKIAQLYKVEIPYTDLKKFKYFANTNNILILKEEYLINVNLEVATEDDKILSNISKNEINIIKKEFINKIYI